MSVEDRKALAATLHESVPLTLMPRGQAAVQAARGRGGKAAVRVVPKFSPSSLRGLKDVKMTAGAIRFAFDEGKLRFGLEPQPIVEEEEEDTILTSKGSLRAIQLGRAQRSSDPEM